MELLKSPNAVRYTLLTGTCLLLAGDLGHGLHIEHGPSSANTWAQCLLVLITTDIYWNSTWQELRSPQFRTGLYLAQWIHVYTQVREQLPYRRQYAVPGIVRRHLGNLTGHDIHLWRMAAAAAITAEIMLPPAPLYPPTMPYAVATGIAMHTAFTCLKPRQLITFSGLNLGTGVAFAARPTLSGPVRHTPAGVAAAHASSLLFDLFLRAASASAASGPARMGAPAHMDARRTGNRWWDCRRNTPESFCRPGTTVSCSPLMR